MRALNTAWVFFVASCEVTMRRVLRSRLTLLLGGVLAIGASYMFMYGKLPRLVFLPHWADVPLRDVHRDGMFIGLTIEEAEEIVGVRAQPVRGADECYVFSEDIRVGWIGEEILTVRVVDGVIASTEFEVED